MMPSHFLSCERSSRFWTDLIGITDVPMVQDGEGCRTKYGGTSESHQIDWSLPAGFALRLRFNAHLDAELFLVTPGGEAITLGWDDQAHWHPHVLRRDELERICRVIALINPHDSYARHPGWPIRLLDRFAPVCDTDNINAAYSTFFAAHRNQSRLDDETIRQLVQHSDCRGNGFVWEETQELGWLIHQTDEADNVADRSLYSLRVRPVTRSPQQQEIMDEMRKRGVCGPEHVFPYRQWKSCLAAVDEKLQQLRVIANYSDAAQMFAESDADETYRTFVDAIESAGQTELAAIARDDAMAANWIAEEALGYKAGTLANQSAEKFSIPTIRSFSVHYAIPDQPCGTESPLFSKLFFTGLNAMLRDLKVGTADLMSSGSRMTSDGREISTGQSDTIRTSLTDSQLVDLVRRWFVFGGGPSSGADDQPRPTLTRKSFSDPLDDDLHHRPSGEFIFNLTRLRTDVAKWGFALRRVAIADSIRTEIAKELATAGFRVEFRSEVDDGDGLTLRIGNIDPEAAGILWQVLHRHELLLLPRLIATSQSAADQVQMHSEFVTLVESPSDLMSSLMSA